IFAAFLGYNPVSAIISQLPANVAGSIPPSVINVVTSNTWFPSIIAPSFMQALRIAFLSAAILSFAAAITSALRGKMVVYEERTTEVKEQKRTN
ncbi:MAG: MFS transporter, partial [Metallosphaera sp.]